MSYFSNQNLQMNGSALTGFGIIGKQEVDLLPAQQGYQDSSTLSTFIDLDPSKNMMLLESAWDKQVLKRTSFADNLYNDALKNNAVLEINGNEFSYKMAVETDNCMRIVEDSSDQSPDGFLGGDGTSFYIVLNKQLSPFQVISCDMAYGDALIVDDQEVEYVGYGFKHWVKLVGSEEDRFKKYDASLLKADIQYTTMSGSFITEYSEKLAKSGIPAGTTYTECKFRLGSGQGWETWITGVADRVKLLPGYVTADTNAYLQELASMGLDADTDVAAISFQSGNRQITTVADLVEMMAIRNFRKKFNTSLMFMPGARISTSKGALELNEGLWRQMRRGKIFTYNRKGNFDLQDAQAVSNYVFKHNSMRQDDRMLRIKAGSMLADNLEKLIQDNAIGQVNNLGNLINAESVMGQKVVSGSLDDMKVNRVRFTSAYLPGVGMLEVSRDTTMDYMAEADVTRRGINPNGYDHTTYSGVIWDVTDQAFSNNAKLPDGVTQVGGETRATKNVYLVRPERFPIVWGRENGRYSSQKASDIVASSKTMHESFFIYGYGAMWLTDPSKFVMIELKEKRA